MGGMVDDLLGYTRTQLGSGWTMSPVAGDIAEACESAIEDARATYPDTNFELEAKGDLQGAFDPIRMHQLLINLLLNAAQYGAKREPVAVVATRHDDGSAKVQVINRGPVVSAASLREIFKPLVQLVPGTGAIHPSQARPLACSAAEIGSCWSSYSCEQGAAGGEKIAAIAAPTWGVGHHPRREQHAARFSLRRSFTRFFP